MITQEEIEKAADKRCGTDDARAGGFHDGANWAIKKMENSTKIGDEVWCYSIKSQVLHVPNELNNTYIIKPLDYHDTIGHGCGKPRTFEPKEFDKECLPILSKEPATIQEAHQKEAERILADKISDLNMVDPKMYEKLKSFKIMDKEEVLSIKTDARQVALNIAMTLNESSVSVCAVTKDEVMANANEIYDWLTQDLEGK